MKIPNELKDGAHIVPVKRHTPQENELAAYYDRRYDFISVQSNDDFSESRKIVSFLHEIIELINDRYQLDLKHSQVAILGEMLFAIMRNNALNFGDTE